MTENEAIRDLQYLVGEYSAYPPETGVSTTIGSLQYCISALKEIQQYREIGTVEDIKQAIGVLSLSENDIVETFHELNEYRKIGTVEECQETVKKQKAKKCVEESCPDHMHYKCPSCGKVQKTKYGNSEFGCILNYCSNCGQAIDENLEGMEDE